MATPSRVLPDPVRTAGTSWAGRAADALAEALRLTEDAEDSAWLAAHEGDLRRELAPLAVAGETPVLRIHGDLHVGQVLRWRDGFAIVDFDGNPTVSGASPYQPAARDLAQLTTSLEHVAQVAVKRRGADPQAMAAWGWMARECREIGGSGAV
jgi:predicted trehalose synthase